MKLIKPAKEVILVLTKSDLVDPAALAAWRIWVKEWWGEDQVEVVSVMSYDLDFLRGKIHSHRLMTQSLMSCRDGKAQTGHSSRFPGSTY